MKSTTPMAFAPASSSLFCFFFFALFLLIGINPLRAQRNFTLYNFNGVPQSYGLNPGRMPMSDVFVTLPAVGNLNLNYSNNAFTFSTLQPDNSADDADSTGMERSGFFSNDFQSLINGMPDNNRMMLDLQAGWIDAGFRVGQNFFNFSVSEHINGQVDFPRALFTMLNDVSSADTSSLFIRGYDLSSLGISANHYRAYGLGYTRQVTPRLSAGIKLKYLTGFGNLQTENSGLTMVNNSTSNFLTVRGTLGIYSAGFASLENDPSAYWKSRGNNGFAFDFGASYSPTDQLELFASVLNIGSINWKSDLTFDGIVGANFNFPTDDIDGFEAEVNRLLDSLSTSSQMAIPAYSTSLPAMGYLGANYFIAPQTSIGVMINPRFFNGKTDFGFSVGAQTRLGRFFQAGLNYSMYNRSAFNLGAGAAVNLGPLQVFMATDNLLSIFKLQNANNAHVNAGISLAFGRRTRSEQLALWEGEKEDKDKLTEDTDIAIVDLGDGESGNRRVSGGKYASGKQASGSNQRQKAEKAPKAKPEKAVAAAPAPKPSTAAPAAPSTTPPAPAAPAAAPALRRYFALKGNVQAQSGELIKGVQVDAYVQLPGGGEELAYTRNFFFGNYEVLMERDKTYRVIIRKEPFSDEQAIVTPADMTGKNEIQRNFTLK